MKRFLARILAGATALTLAACSSGGGTSTAVDSAEDKLVVGVVPSSNVASLYLGVEKGFFKDKGLTLDLRPSQGFAANVASVSNGETNIGFGTTVPIVGAIANGVPIKLLAHSDVLGSNDKDYSGLFVPKGSGIKSIKDLEGKTVAVNALSNVFDVAIKSAMTKAGADPTKVKFLEVALPDMVAALDTHRVDAAAVGEPFFTLARNAGNTMVMKVFSAGFAAGTPLASYFVSDAWAGNHAAALKKFVDALDESSKYAAAHPDEAHAIMTTYTQIPKEVLGQVELGNFNSTVDLPALQNLEDLMVSTKTIQQAPPVDSLVVKVP